MHGNEQAGVLALKRVIGALESRRERLYGDVVALVGNRGALARERRFLARDLNRMWTPEGVQAVQGTPGPGGAEPEAREQAELLQALEEAVARARGEVLFLDLHTTSGPGTPFITVVDGELSRELASSIPVPLILGLGEMLQGTLAGHLTSRRIPSVVFEGGQHSSSESLAASEAALWVALAGTRMLRETGLPEVRQSWEHLREATRDLPPLFEMRYRHSITPEDEFRMLPGFRSFQPVVAGEVLATDRTGEVRAPEGGRLLLPLYQAQGEDGFFLVRTPKQMS
jgi:succinylglutamate desuccinylase